ncbi:peroxiredoxin [Gammaproteobacteria bacterium AS21]
MIEIGQKIANITLKTMAENGPQAYETLTNFTGKKVVLFAVPGAFTPTCSAAHLPGFVVQYDEIIATGVDIVACVSVNDVFVMDAWGKSSNAENITMLADGNGLFTQAVGLELDATGFDMGARSKRYAMIIDNGIVTHLAVDSAGLENSSAQAVLKILSK